MLPTPGFEQSTHGAVTRRFVREQDTPVVRAPVYLMIGHPEDGRNQLSVDWPLYCEETGDAAHCIILSGRPSCSRNRCVVPIRPQDDGERQINEIRHYR